MPKKIKIIFLATIVIAAIFSITLPALADNNWLSTIGIPNGQIIPTACTGSQVGKSVNDCGLSAMFQTIVNVSQLILALTGSAALLMFVYGGVLWIISAGSAEQIQKGKSAMTAAAIGIAIILLAWTAVNVTISVLTGGEIGNTATIFNAQPWFQEYEKNYE